MKQKILLFATIALVAFNVFAQKKSDLIPFDKNTKVGKLANGLTYYIRKNGKPENKAELRLVVNAGSILERDDQQGVAHFLEHMAFNGTKNFPKNELLSYLQKAGVRFGADLNATTSTDFTLYMLPIPTTDAAILKNGYQVLRDWAGGLLLEPEEIDKERGIILEEKRMRQNAGMRTYAQFLPVLTNNSKYGQRIPIGKEEIIKTAPRKAFTDFYSDWYRPDNMAIIAVGDIDLIETEQLIKTLFSDLKNPVNAPERPIVTPINWHKQNAATIVSDAENTNNILSIYFGLNRNKIQKTWGDYGDDVVNNMISTLLNNRLQENAVNPKSPISFGSIMPKSSFLKGYETASLFAAVKDNPTDAINLTIGEILKAKEFGFTQAEIDRVKKSLLKSYEEGLLEKDKTESSSYVNEYVEHFLNQAPSPGIEAEQKFVATFIQTITPETINNALKIFDLNKPAFIVYNVKESAKSSTNESGLITAFENAKSQKVEAYVEKNIGTILIEKIPVAAKIKKSDFNTDLDATTLTLPNGITVIYKKTSFKNDEIVLNGRQWGGSTNLTSEEIKTSNYFSLVNSMGLGKNKAVDMPKLMTGVQANVFIMNSPNQFIINGNASSKDIEKFMQLLYLKLTQVNFDADEFEGIKSNYANQIGGLLKNPSFKFSDSLNKFKFNNSNRITGLPLEAEAKNLQLNDLQALYKKLTGNLNGAVLTFTGNIDESSFIKLVEQYIASIPTQANAATLNASNLAQPITGKNSFVINGGKENKSEINHTYYGKINETNYKEIQAFLFVGEILQMNATQKLREEMGSTYSPRVSSSIIRKPIGDFSLNLTVSSLPENTEKIIIAFDELVQKMVKGDVSDEDVQKAKAQRLKSMETAFKTNTFWGNILEQQFNYQFKALNETAYNKMIEEITKEDIINAAKKYLATSNILKAVMNPE